MKKYYTHAGLFHCDEVAGYAITYLADVCDEHERLTDINNIPDDGVVADIGRVYNPRKNMFDHHQGMLLRENGYPLASAGLLWREYGARAVRNLCDKASDEDVSLIVKRVDESLIQGIDAHDSDNGYTTSAKCIGGKVRVMTLSNVISTFNTSDVSDKDKQDTAFEMAASFMYGILKNEIRAAQRHVENVRAFDDVADVHGEIIILSRHIAWKEIVAEKHPNAKFVIAPSSHPGSPFSLLAVPVEPDSREVKVPIERPSYFDGFIHQGKWIAGGDSIKTLLRLATYNLQ